MPQQSAGSSVPWPTLMALVVAVGGATLYFHPLTSDRPDFSGGNAQSLGNEDVEARLWQDPFQAVYSTYHAPASWTESMSVDLERGSTDIVLGSVRLGHQIGESIPTTQASGIDNTAAAYPSTQPQRNAARHSLEEIQNEITDAATNDDAPILILPVMVQADAYPEVTERRLRTRVAVLEALGIRGYSPVDTVHIGYFTTKWPAARLDDLPPAKIPNAEYPGVQTMDLVVPYEWCVASGIPMGGSPPATKYKRVLVLWINENVFYDFPVTRLGWLLQILIPCHVNADVTIIGPSVSTTLRAMVEEAAKLPAQPPTGCPLDSFGRSGTVRMLSPWATASDEALSLGVEPSKSALGQYESIEAYLSRRFAGDRPVPFQFVRTTHNDLDICKELAAELYRRDLDIPAGKQLALHDDNFYDETNSGDDGGDDTDADRDDCVAVIGEWDTFFGRALPLTFAAVASGHSLKDLVDHPEHFPEWIKPFVYLRGIDGKTASSLPGQEGGGEMGSDRSKSQTGDQGNLKVNGPEERPEGMNESDYLRRLADQLADWDAILKRDGKRLAAVGILGTDLYDKLLVLRAVRDRLPSGIVYFTTDLDARYNLPSEWKTTHNLVVAASYGLRLHRYYQGNISPFRDSLETAAFAATVAAVDPNQMSQGWNDQLSWPRIFEIGRTSAFDMSVDNIDEPTEWKFGTFTGTQTVDKPKIIQPERFDLETWWGTPHRISFLLLMLFFLALLLSVTFHLVCEKKLKFCNLFNYTTAFVILAIGGIGIFIAILVSLYEVKEEPFAWIEGISVWPTEAVRLLAALLCIHFIIKAKYEVERSDKKLSEQFKLTSCKTLCKQFREDCRRTPSLFRKTLLNSFRNWAVYGSDDSGEDRFPSPKEVKPRPTVAKVYAEAVWREYILHAKYSMRFCASSHLPRFISARPAVLWQSWGFLVPRCEVTR